ncbi:hypothetical protein H4684_003744 [Desulfomicrobium macestii]|uniref:Uncharacterized protein n=1 Tax=Desulfomicrobium macestii TaxID=90731 RepID=A0ABR9H8K2_9BACT|nr:MULTISPECIES: hypothetical protein [Desulfomicrobium]MBE1427056.1 hypothetical protein [Desulfomicrobium macestii]
MDCFCDTKQYLEYVKLLHYLRRYGYNDYLTSDTSPAHGDIRRTFKANARLTNAV